MAAKSNTPHEDVDAHPFSDRPALESEVLGVLEGEVAQVEYRPEPRRGRGVSVNAPTHYRFTAVSYQLYLSLMLEFSISERMQHGALTDWSLDASQS